MIANYCCCCTEGDTKSLLLHFRPFVALSVSVPKIRYDFARASLIPVGSPPRLNMGSVGYSRSEAPSLLGINKIND